MLTIGPVHRPGKMLLTAGGWGRSGVTQGCFKISLQPCSHGAFLTFLLSLLPACKIQATPSRPTCHFPEGSHLLQYPHCAAPPQRSWGLPWPSSCRRALWHTSKWQLTLFSLAVCSVQKHRQIWATPDRAIFGEAEFASELRQTHTDNHTAPWPTPTAHATHTSHIPGSFRCCC